MTRFAPIAAILLFSASTASAALVARFDEGAPKDRFSVTNTSACALDALDVTIDLTGSAAGLVFDVTETGAGVEVYQPFELVSGADLLTALPEVADGDTAVTLRLSGLAPNQTVSFTIDVDDTLGSRAITVSNAEIVGASVMALGVTADFDQTSAATLPVENCLS